MERMRRQADEHAKKHSAHDETFDELRNEISEGKGGLKDHDVQAMFFKLFADKQKETDARFKKFEDRFMQMS